MKQLWDNLSYSNINLTDMFFIDKNYSENHAHMLHKHKGVLELLYIADGEGRYIVGNRNYAVRAGDLVICNADTLHGEAPFQKHNIQTYCCAMENVSIDYLAKGRIIAQEKKPVLTLEKFNSLVGELMINLYTLHKEKDNKLICNQMATTLLLLVCKIISTHDKQNKFIVEQKNENMIRKLTNYLDANYKQDVSLDKISAVMHISVSHISHLFKRETGLSPMQYVIHRRIGEAQSLLAETNLPIKEIEEKLGFGSSCHLTAMFKKYVGLSPREYRKYFMNTDKKST